MKTNASIIARLARASVRLGGFLTVLLLGLVPSLVTGATVTTLGGGNPNVTPKYQGYKDGNTLTNALFRTPYGLALDEAYGYLYVADRDNNAIRTVDLVLGQTYTFAPTNLTSRPVGVAVDGNGNVFVLNRGSTNAFSTNGSVLMFDTYGDLLTINASKLTNASSLALDTYGNIYVAVRSNTLIKISSRLYNVTNVVDGSTNIVYATNIVGNATNIVSIGTNTVISVTNVTFAMSPTTNITTVATITNVGTSLQGIVAKHNGMIAACDSGRHGIYLINPDTGNVTTNAGFNGAGDGTGTANHGVLKTNAMFNQPTGLAEVGDGSLIVTDTGNHKVKVVNATIVTNLYGVTSTYWAGTYPGWYDGLVKVPETITPNVQARNPVGVAFASDGTVYTTEDYYHLIRKVTGTGLPQPPPPPPQVPTPQIGYVDFPATAIPPYTSVFHPVSSFIFNNDRPLIILGTLGSETFYEYKNDSNLGNVPDPGFNSPQASTGYQDGLSDQNLVKGFGVAQAQPYVSIKAIGEKNDGSPNSAIAQAKFQFVTANPSIKGDDALDFTVSDETQGSTLWYTTDGTDPAARGPSVKSIAFTASADIVVNTATPSIGSNDFTLKCYATKVNYQDSYVVSKFFSVTNSRPNHLTFGLTNGEPSSSFVARPGQVFYAPVTLQLRPSGDVMYSLQFNVSVTNGVSTTNKITNGAGIGFFPMLMTQVPIAEGRYYPPADGRWFLTIPPVIMVSSNVAAVPGLFTNSNNNLLGVGWLFRTGFRYALFDTNGDPYLDFDTAAQDLISYSIAHDTLFSKVSGTVVAGAYSFRVPDQAKIGDQYFIQLGSASATRDGVGAPGADVHIEVPTNSQAVTVGSPAYVVGDAAPFRWLNAGDFGEGILNNADVMQVFQSAIEQVDMPPTNSDLVAAMDSSGSLGGWDSVNKYFTNSSAAVSAQALLDGNDLTINTNAFGDGSLDVSDLYVTFRRSLDPSLTWFKRYWTNGPSGGQFVAVPTANLAYNSNTPHMFLKTLNKTAAGANLPESVTFSAGDAINAGGQTVQIPITANIFGGYPLRVLGLNLTVHPLDGSPDITNAVQFTPAASLGVPTITAAKSAANYSAAWLSSTISGLASNAAIGTLTVTLPGNATNSSAYAVHFDHVSASPNGLICFPEQELSGLITVTSRTNSYYHDGIPDSWRLRWFGTIYNSLSISNADACGDGINNYQKFIAGTDPTVAGAYPQLKSKMPVPAGATTAIHWPTVSGKQYAIERSPSLFPGVWTSLTTNTGTGTDMEFNDNSAGPVKFYRVRILP